MLLFSVVNDNDTVTGAEGWTAGAKAADDSKASKRIAPRNIISMVSNDNELLQKNVSNSENFFDVLWLAHGSDCPQVHVAVPYVSKMHTVALL